MQFSFISIKRMSHESVLLFIQSRTLREGYRLRVFFDRILMKILRCRTKLKTKLHGLSPRANYTGRATVACRRSECQLLRIEGATWSA
jgi:hypothetical protein